MEKTSLLLVFFLALGSFASAGLKDEEVTYTANGLNMKGYLVYDDATKGKRPGVIVVHEWWGHNEYARKRARMLAELGYTALAVDMFGDGKTAAHPDDAKKFTGEVMSNMDAAKARFLAAMDLLQKHTMTDPARIAAIGYCFGGSTVLEMARMGVDLRGVASFHGGLSTTSPAKPGMVKASVLVCHGAADSFVSPEAIDAFKKEMADAKVNFMFLVYENAIHSFTNPEADQFAKKFNLALAYNADADKKSWADLQDFLKRVLAQ